ncbi:VRR-NUC domain-containing protein [Steroidobacter flavus]|uniref:phosphodiesterase I n=1 Tax=Steroidobacter flavus TaxID=1842136 RepID=A0ABV8SWM7_9GAMM
MYRVTIAPTVTRFRLLHFGNFHQDWHEYTLSHLQIFNYEPVALDLASRPFESRKQIEFFYALYECHEAMSEGAALPELLARLPDAPRCRGWLHRAWDRLRFAVGQAAELDAEPDTALGLYRNNGQIDAQVREVRLLECLKREEEALSRARSVLATGGSERMRERVSRIVARLERRRGARSVRSVTRPAWSTSALSLVQDPDRRVEWLVQAHLSSDDAPVFYVENSLLCSLFGLACWQALFAPVRGAFFHPFQAAPADLYCPDFVAKRRNAFDACLERLDTGEYVEAILRTFADEHGTRAPFVHWFAFDEATLRLALACIPAVHLKLYFARMLEDLGENTSGFPDLVQFFVKTRTYRFIEVKGPGDRVQDNQRRWLTYCARCDLPVEVCQVRWADPGVPQGWGCLRTQRWHHRLHSTGEGAGSCVTQRSSRQTCVGWNASSAVASSSPRFSARTRRASRIRSPSRCLSRSIVNSWA